MRIQIIEDSEGEATGVYIPIKEWMELKRQYRDLEALEYYEPSKEQIIGEIKSAMQELESVEQWILKARPAIELLNEL